MKNDCAYKEKCMQIRKGEEIMAIARKCDRCGKFYEYYPKGNKVEYNGVQRIYRHKNRNLGNEKTHENCPE